MDQRLAIFLIIGSGKLHPFHGLFAGLGAFAEVSLFSAASAFLVNSSASAVIPAIEYARAQLRQIIA